MIKNIKNPQLFMKLLTKEQLSPEMTNKMLNIYTLSNHSFKSDNRIS